MLAEKGNKVLTISEYDIDKYLAQGFDIKDDSGNILKKSLPTTVSGLKAEIERLTEENEQLKKLLADKDKKTAKATPVVEKPVTTEQVEEPELVTEPKRKRNTKV